MTRFGAVVFSLALCVACASDKRFSRDGESCVKTDDCVAPLRCALNHCVGQEEANDLIQWWRSVRLTSPASSQSGAGMNEFAQSRRGQGANGGNTPPRTGFGDTPMPKSVPQNIKPAAGIPKVGALGPTTPPPAGVPPTETTGNVGLPAAGVP